MSKGVLLSVDLTELLIDTRLKYDLLALDESVILKAGSYLTADTLENLRKYGESFFYRDESKQEPYQPVYVNCFDPEVTVKFVTELKDIFRHIRAGGAISPEILDKSRNFIRESYDGLRISKNSYLNLLLHPADDTDWFERHSINVCLIVMVFAFSLRFAKEDILDYALGALLHDIGHLKAEHSLLNSVEVLSEDKKLPFRKHPHAGYELLKGTGVRDIVKQAVLFHHERFDEKGYPTTLPYDRLPLSAKLVSVAEVFESLLNARPYRKGFGVKKSLLYLIRCTATYFDEDYVNKFIRALGPLLTKYESILAPGMVIRTNFGEYAKITALTKNWLAPEIEIFTDAQGRPLSRSIIVDMTKDHKRFLAYAYEAEESAEVLS